MTNSTPAIPIGRKQLIAIDLGNTTAKIKCLLGEYSGASQYIDGTAIGEKTQFTQQLSDIFEFELPQSGSNHRFLWGPSISATSFKDGVVETRSDGVRYLEQPFRNMMEMILGYIAYKENLITPLPDGRLSIDLSIGLPTDDYDSNRYLQNSDGSFATPEDFAKGIESDPHQNNYIAFLKGEHVVVVNGLQFIITVNQISIADQPQGTLVNQVFNEFGEYTHPEYMNGHVTEIDFGGLTILTSQYERGTRLAKSSQINEGAYRLAENVATRWNKSDKANPRLKVTMDQVLRMLREHDKADAPFIVRYNQNTRYDVTDIVKDEMKKSTEMVIAQLKKLEGWQLSDAIFVTGGGANLVDYNVLNHFLELYGLKATKVADSTFANVRGFHILGMLKNNEVGETYVSYVYGDPENDGQTAPRHADGGEQ